MSSEVYRDENGVLVIKILPENSKFAGLSPETRSYSIKTLVRLRHEDAVVLTSGEAVKVAMAILAAEAQEGGKKYIKDMVDKISLKLLIPDLGR